MPDIAWRHRPSPTPMPVVPYERVYIPPEEPPPPPIRPIRSRPQQIIDEVCRDHGIEFGDLINRRSPFRDQARMLAARIDAARRLRALPMSTNVIGRFMKRDHSTVLSYIQGRTR